MFESALSPEANALHPPTFLLLLLLLLAPTPARAEGLYVVGQSSESVQEYDESSGAFVRLVTETVQVGFVNPGGIAIRPSDGVLHVASATTGELWRYTTATGQVIEPALRSGLQAPRGLAFDASGSTLFFADPADSLSETTDSVKALTIGTGALVSVGSTSNAEFADVVVNATHVFASDSDGNRIVRFPVGGGSGSSVINSGLDEPTGLLLRSATELLIADSGSDRVLEYDLVSGSWVFDRVVLDASAGVVDPCGLALAPDGRLSVSGCTSNDVVAVDLGTLAVMPLVAPGAAGLSIPKDVEWSGNTLLAASAGANAVLYYDAAGAATGVAARGISNALDGGFAFSPNGQKFYVASFSDNVAVEHSTGSGALLRRFGAPCSLLPIDLEVGPDGDLYVLCFGNHGVNRVDLASGATLGAFVASGSGGLVNPRNLVFGPDGDLYVSSANGEVLEFDGATGAFVRVMVDSGGNGGGPVDPYGMTFHQGVLYVASLFPSEVKAFDATTGAFVSTFVSGGSGGLSSPTSLAFGPDGELYVASRDDDAVRRYDGASGAFVSVFVAPGSGGLDAPLGLAFRPPALQVPALAPLAALLLAAGLVANARGLRRAPQPGER